MKNEKKAFKGEIFCHSALNALKIAVVLDVELVLEQEVELK